MRPIAKDVGVREPTSGSWLVESSSKLAAIKDIELSIIAPHSINKTITKNNINYYLVKTKMVDMFVRPRKKIKNQINKLIEEIQPDIIHIQGSEFAFNDLFLDVENIPTVLSIQGLMSEITKYHYQTGFIAKNPYRKYGRGNFIRIYGPEFLKNFRNMFRSKAEIRQLKRTRHIIGRTEWDRAHTYYINPKANYYFLQETIRNSFLNLEWNENEREEFVIFCGGGYQNPLKGAHVILEAVSLLREEFPKIKVRIVGENIYSLKNSKGYHRLLLNIIYKKQMSDIVSFTGKLDEEKMALEFKKAHVYVMGSSIENSSNTLGEALFVGTPSVVPFVGGNSSISADSKESIYYRFGDFEHLAWNIRTLFLNNNITNELSRNAKKRASIQYDNDFYINDLIDIYSSIINNT